MTDTIARLRVGNKVFETMVNMEKALDFKKGKAVNVNDFIADKAIYNDLKKGLRASSQDLMAAFQTSELSAVVGQIVKKGSLEVSQEFRDEAFETRKKQVVEFFVKNAVDSRTGRPYTPDMISSAIKSAGARIDNQAADKQIARITEELAKIIPIKIETKKISIKIPAIHTGKVYGLLQDYKEKEDWLGDGSLQVILNIPVGLLMDFYDKLNSVTHGSAIAHEIKQ